jgi:hypothetical protein
MMKLGTVEPVYIPEEKVKHDFDINDRMAFIRGLVKKYRYCKDLNPIEIFEYLEKMVESKEPDDVLHKQEIRRKIYKKGKLK